jgi:hypothetical protein
MEKLLETNLSLTFLKTPEGAREWQSLITLTNNACKTHLNPETVKELQKIIQMIRTDLVETNPPFKDRLALIKRLVMLETVVYGSDPSCIDSEGLKYDPYYLSEFVEEALVNGDLSSPRFLGLYEIVKLHASLDNDYTPFNEYFGALTEDIARILHSDEKNEIAKPLEEELFETPNVAKKKNVGPKKPTAKRCDVYELDDLHTKGISILDVDVTSLLSKIKPQNIPEATQVFIGLMMDFYQDRVAMYTEGQPEYLYHGSKTDERMEYVNIQISDSVDLLQLWIDQVSARLTKSPKRFADFVIAAADFLESELRGITEEYGLESRYSPFDTILSNLKALKDLVSQEA